MEEKTGFINYWILGEQEGKSDSEVGMLQEYFLKEADDGSAHGTHYQNPVQIWNIIIVIILSPTLVKSLVLGACSVSPS